MAFQEKIGARSVRLAMSALALIAAGNAAAQEAPMQRVEITGSAIKRIAVEGALPVQRLSAETIAKTGAGTVADLIQALPAMQGFTVDAVAAGSNSGGNVSASIHNIGEEYTLVLLNGRRVAPQGSGSAVNLNAIPMSAVERVEILTDGASALYGSDAIAGVINFILKDSVKATSIEANITQPFDSSAGRQTYFNLTSGWTDEAGRIKLVGSYRHDERTAVKATEREFAKTSYVPFTHNGHNYVMDRTSSSAIPANVQVKMNKASGTGTESIGFNPYYKANGKCAPVNFYQAANDATTQNCGFDSGTMVEIVPENKRDSFFGKATFKLTDNINLFAETALSRLDLTARIAANTAPISVAKGSAYYNDYVKPYLTADQDSRVTSVNALYRTFDFGSRASNTITDSTHFVTGAEGELGAWSFNTGLTWSRNKIDERYVGGYALNQPFRDMIASRTINPFEPIGSTKATAQQLSDATFIGSIREASTTLKGIDARGSRELFNLPGGAVQIAVGGDFRNYHYEQTPSEAASNGSIYNFSTPARYDMDRDTYGLFTELAAPVTKSVEVTGAVRYDGYSAIDNGLTNTTMGKREHATTYKVSARWQPTQGFLVRGSYGTGFKAPSMLNIGQPLVTAGFTASSYGCPTVLGNDSLCQPGKSQYNVYSGGNPDLRPEKSKQFTIGFRAEPTNAFSFGADLWDVKMTDAVSEVSEQLAFSDPVKFRDLFTTFTQPATGATYWAFKSLSINIGKTHSQGLDWDFTARHKFGFGNLTSNLAGTYLIKSDYTEPGTSDKWTNDMNFFGTDNKVAFRHVVRWTTTLETGAFSNTLIANYRNGYTDASATVLNLDTNVSEKIRLHVPSHLTWDWQGKWTVNKQLALRAGIKNLLDRDPPLSLRNSSGHQVGFDPRYADPMGRTFYLTGNYAF
ncbi:TonB-dependent receptor [Duganella sp. Root1480D1]|uniref:TonB-dependent receptor n=1 Tax=Duganella sp. Root1480D1 TaxID=1736471 RepID=UPI00070D8139|nr:TonB-dependent receptor [Duganella sp. Root1480D1]KQZ41403.1 TonB-dependent receptor [Duganella sp. Root1480D1]